MSDQQSNNTPEPMKYGLLGEDDMPFEEKVAKYTGEVDWSYLEPHYKNEALLWVDPSLELKDVAKALGDDDTETVANWLGNGDLVKIGSLHAMQWEGTDEKFTALVVTPFVLMQQKR
ncbi:DUF2288 family protein [Sulfuriroseicoccus oceanibius]|uniref:DUF2288 family protein n=1 Tax=Sulfuriroseicoccus oceanibius TaxID=2707525 RepID=A0A6B3L611_9BACT|nr:DUF2288 family protein [Sulfuriroseicoccus oceanibius]QQL44464.1 DUF2288 family protein [Sulfuriroseicoccus oceanibius]